MPRRSKTQQGDGLSKVPGSPYWQIDKQYAGARLRCSSRTTDRGEAKAQIDVWIAERKKALAITRLGLEPKRDPHARPEMTIDEAATRYYAEIGATTKTADNIDMNLAWIVANIAPNGAGKNTKLSEIDEPMLLALAARRRGEGSRRGDAKSWKPLSEASINRYVLDIVRRLLRRASITWKVAAAVIDWNAIRTPESREGLFGRELPAAVETKLYDGELREDLHDFAEFIIIHTHRAGFARQMEWAHVDFDAGVYRIRRKTRKPGEHFQEYPMTAAARRLLLRQRGLHPKFVWTYEVHRRHGRWAKGGRRPLTATVVRQQLGAALKRLMGAFRVHDLRHTGARRTLRKTKNLRAVQRVLGHSDVATTALYADVMHDDIRAAIEETDAAYNPRKTPAVIEGGASEASEDKEKKTA